MIRNMSSPRNLLAVLLAGLIAVAAFAIATPAQATTSVRTVAAAPTDLPAGPSQLGGSANVPADRTLAAGPCWYSGGHWWCNNIVGAPMFNTAWQVVDYMYSNPSWFVCRAEGGRNNNGPHPNRWVLTQGDAYGAWGWMRDGDIYSETDPLPTC